MSSAAPPGWRLLLHDELASTQDAAIDAAKCGEAGRLAIMARRQSAGRGRGGRVWEAPAGNLNLSVMLRPAFSPRRPGLWALLAGIALHTSLCQLARGAQDLRLKWPNDILLAGAKLGGVLIDAAQRGGTQAEWIVIGFGANIASSPVLEDRETACLAQLDAGISAEMVAQQLLRCLDHCLSMPDDAIRADWLARAHPCGTRIRVQKGAAWIDGIFAGLAEDGALLLEGHAAPIYTGDTMLAGKPTAAPAPCC